MSSTATGCSSSRAPTRQRIVTKHDGELILSRRRRPGALALPGAARRHAGGLGRRRGEARRACCSRWDPYTTPIISDLQGTIRFRDIVEDETIREEFDELTGLRQRVIIEDREKKLHPHIEIVQTKGGKEKKVRDFVVPEGRAADWWTTARRSSAGQTLAKISREAYKTRDITGGLPRVAELFEARRPKDPATISEIDGVVRFGEIKRGKREILVHHIRTLKDGSVVSDESAGAAAVRGAGRQALARPRGRPGAGGRPPHRGPGEPARHPADQGSARGAGVPPQRSAGGLPAPGREDQRQAHRRDRQADAAEGAHPGPGRHRVPGRRARGQGGLPRREHARDAQEAASPPRRSRCCSGSPRRA